MAGLVSLAVSLGIIIGKAFRLQHPALQWQEVVIGFGVFIFAVLLLPSYVGRDDSEQAPKLTLQQRAARADQCHCTTSQCSNRRVGELIATTAEARVGSPRLCSYRSSCAPLPCSFRMVKPGRQAYRPAFRYSSRTPIVACSIMGGSKGHMVSEAQVVEYLRQHPLADSERALSVRREPADFSGQRFRVSAGKHLHPEAL